MEKKEGFNSREKRLDVRFFLTKVCGEGFLCMQTYKLMDITRLFAV